MTAVDVETELGLSPFSVVMRDGMPFRVDGGPLPPLVVSPRQLRRALIDFGILPEQIAAQLATIPDANERAKAAVDWEFATEVRRGHPLISQLAAVFGLSSKQVDALFAAAATQ